MPVTLIFRDGTPYVEIECHKRKLWDYSIESIGFEGLLRCYRIARVLDNEDEAHTYYVKTSGSVWSCTCRAFQFRAHLGADSCKHCRAVFELVETMAALAVG